MAVILLGVGMALTLEGLFLALAPGRIEEALELLRRLPIATRRTIGLGALAVGVLLVWLAERGLG